jgi:hypothetical protein
MCAGEAGDARPDGEAYAGAAQQTSGPPAGPIATLSNDALLAETARAAGAARRATAYLISLLIEVDARRLYLGQRYPSLFAYCTQALHLSEHAAYERISAARTARRLPAVLERLADGSISLATIGLLAPHLNDDNCDRVLEAVRHRSKRDVERLVAGIDPKPDIPASIRRLPASQPGESVRDATLLATTLAGDAGPEAGHLKEVTPPPSTSAAGGRPTIVVVLAPERYLIRVTVGGQTHEKFRRAQVLLRHSIPNGDPATVIDRALTVLVKQLERTRFANSATPRSAATATPNSRYVPANVKRLVWKRDGGRCAFCGEQGRCTETEFQEFHHIVPYAAGGPTSVDNLALRCRSHNAYESAQRFHR